jgi:hypothetical protein
MNFRNSVFVTLFKEIFRLGAPQSVLFSNPKYLQNFLQTKGKEKRKHEGSFR